MADSSAHRTFDPGNAGQCTSAGYQACLLELGGYGGTPFGLCLPTSCGPDEFANASSPVWIFVAETVPYIIAAEALFNNELPLLITCGDHAVALDDWSSDATACVAALALLAAAVLAASAYTLVGGATAPKKDKGGRAKSVAGIWRDAVVGASLGTTVRSLAGGSRRGPAPGMAAGDSLDTRSMDCVRALSAGLVVLGHSLVFTNGGAGPGFANTSDLVKHFGLASWQVFTSAEFAVDSFFVLSGALGAFLLARELKAALPRWGGVAPAQAGLPASLASVPPALRIALAAAKARLVGSAKADAPAAPLLGDDELGGGSGDGGDAYVELGGGAGGGGAAAVATLPAATAGGAGDIRARDAGTVAAMWAAMVAQRALRVIPAYGAMLGLWMHVMPLTGSGPFWYRWSVITANCRGGTDPHSGSWLWSLLFVNDFVPGVWDGGSDNSCAAWGWYLSTDMQLHAGLLLPACLAWLAHRGLGYVGIAVAALGFTALGLGVVVQQKLLGFVDVGGLGALTDLGGDQWDYYYVKPWCRSPPFLCGVLLGLALTDWADARKQQRQVQLKQQQQQAQTEAHGGVADKEEREGPPAGEERSLQRRAVDALRAAAEAVLPLQRPASPAGATDGVKADGDATDPAGIHWAACGVLLPTLALLGWLFYGPTAVYAGMVATPTVAAWSRAGLIAYTALSRPAWGAALSALLYLACTHRAGRAMSGFMSLPLWVPLGRLSFGVYLLHPLAVGWLALQSPGAITWSVPWFAGFFTAVYALTHCAAALLFVVVEAPFAAVQKAAFATAGVLARQVAAGTKRRAERNRDEGTGA